jgi:hypothetical protein
VDIGRPYAHRFGACKIQRRLPVKAALRKAIGKGAGDTVLVCLEERIG